MTMSWLTTLCLWCRVWLPRRHAAYYIRLLLAAFGLYVMITTLTSLVHVNNHETMEIPNSRFKPNNRVPDPKVKHHVNHPSNQANQLSNNENHPANPAKSDNHQANPESHQADPESLPAIAPNQKEPTINLRNILVKLQNHGEIERTAITQQPVGDVAHIMARVRRLYSKFYSANNTGVDHVTSRGGCDEYNRAASMARLVVPDLLTHAHNVPEDDPSVSLISHMTEDRLPRFEKLLHQWNGPMSITLYVALDHLEAVLIRILEMPDVQARDNLLLHLVPEHGRFYPVNYLRNVALNNTGSRYVFLTDIDFLPVYGTHNILLDELEYVREKKEPTVVFVVPAFEEAGEGLDYKFPENKEDLLDLWDGGTILPFHLETFPSGHHRTNFRRWKKAKFVYKIEWEPLFEPYLAGPRDTLPRYSQMFVGRSMNKIQQVLESVAMGLHMRVHSEVFTVHLAHPPTKRAQVASQKCSANAMKKFNKYLKKKYNFE